MDDDDDNDGEGNDGDCVHGVPPPVSRISRGLPRRYRSLSRAGSRSRSRDRYPRQRKRLPIAALVGDVIRHHGLTDEVRQRVVCLHWPEIAGEKIASKTFPTTFCEGVLHVSAINSSWVHEMQFFKAQLIAQINEWVDVNRVWLGPPPLVTDIRFGLATQRPEWLVDPDHVRRLRARHLRRLRPPEVVSPMVSDAEREAIRTEASTIPDPELRAVVEAVRMTWNR